MENMKDEASIKINWLNLIDITAIIRRVVDGSYVVTRNGLPFHVPNTEEYQDIFAQIDEYAKAHPEAVAEEYPYVPSLDELRTAKLSELSSKFATAEAEAHLTSSLGMVINAGEKANRDIDGLVKLMEAMPNMETVDFCCYDNSFKAVTLADLKTMQVEVILSGNALYSQKWAYREDINAAQSKEELEAIAIEFTYSDFSKEAEAV